MQVEGVGYLDKIEHCFAYAVLVISFLLAFKKAEGLTKRKIYLLIFWASIYGFSLELVQFVFLSYRFFEWKDALANLLGIFSGLAIFKLFDRG
ncbi:VanZ family protein [Ekhidna sp.]|uniref:VanZ family protein n=1 Tax=Ekhidna sp. TaxID=2608089 RepID=UPI003BA89FD6